MDKTQLIEKINALPIELQQQIVDSIAPLESSFTINIAISMIAIHLQSIIHPPSKKNKKCNKCFSFIIKSIIEHPSNWKNQQRIIFYVRPLTQSTSKPPAPPTTQNIGNQTKDDYNH